MMLLLPALLACNESNLSKVRLDAIGVVLGDFDDITTPLTALDIQTTQYDGFIVQATYEPEASRTKRGEMSLQIEGLLTSTDEVGRPDLQTYNALFVASGTRGLGAGQYNNSLLPDDMLLADPNVDALCTFANGGGKLVVSDWAYDLVEHCWPDAVDFAGDEQEPDAAQLGVADVSIDAIVEDEDIATLLGGTLALTYDYSAWTVVEGAGPDTEVLISGDVAYQPAADQPIEELTGVPLMVRFATGSGSVVYTTFHWSAQTPVVAQNLLLAAVDGLAVGAGSESEEAAP